MVKKKEKRINMKNREKNVLNLSLKVWSSSDKKRKTKIQKRMKIEKHSTAQAFCFEKVNIKLVSKLVDHY